MTKIPQTTTEWTDEQWGKQLNVILEGLEEKAKTFPPDHMFHRLFKEVSDPIGYLISHFEGWSHEADMVFTRERVYPSVCGKCGAPMQSWVLR